MCLQIGDGDVAGARARRAGLVARARRPEPGRRADHEPVPARRPRSHSAGRWRTWRAIPCSRSCSSRDGYSNAQSAEPWYPPVGSDLARLLSRRGPSGWRSAAGVGAALRVLGGKRRRHHHGPHGESRPRRRRSSAGRCPASQAPPSRGARSLPMDQLPGPGQAEDGAGRDASDRRAAPGRRRPGCRRPGADERTRRSR